jgi:hypothetical protein
MVDRTSTGNAPWTLVEANDKNFARVKVIRTVCERIEAALDAKPGAEGVAAAEKSSKKKKD